MAGGAGRGAHEGAVGTGSAVGVWYQGQHMVRPLLSPASIQNVCIHCVSLFTLLVRPVYWTISKIEDLLDELELGWQEKAPCLCPGRSDLLLTPRVQPSLV